MNLKLQRIIQKLEKKFPRKIDLTLDRQFKILKKLGNPQDKLERVIAVVGTNSKYTLANVTSSILNEAGHKCNLFLSPHLQSYTERFIYNNNEISEENLIELLEDIEKIIGDNPCTLFEALTCAYLKYCEQFKQNILIIESGLMHYYDSSNVFKKNLASIIGTIGLDHLQWIKNKTIDGVIYEKTAKLLNSNIFVNKQENKEITSKIEKALENNQSNKYFFGKDFNILKAENGFIQYQDQFGEIILPEPKHILGEHNLWNISTAIAAARKLFNVKDEQIKKAVTSIKLKGRLEEIKSGGNLNKFSKNKIYLDIAHNENAARALRNWIDSSLSQFHLIIGMMKEKQHFDFGSALFKGSDKIKSVTLIDIPNTPGAISKENLKKKFSNLYKNIKTKENIFDAIKSLNARLDDKILITGSAYLCGEVLNLN